MNLKILIRIALIVSVVLSPNYLFAADSTTNGLVALWRFDEGTSTLASDYVSGIGATFLGQPAWVGGKLSGAASFDGRTVRASASSSLLTNLTALSISVWINPRTIGGTDGISNERILTKSGLPGGKRFGFHISPDGGLGFYYGFTQAVGSWKTSANTIRLNEWHNVAVTYDANYPNVLPILYIDGVAQQVIESQKPSGTPLGDDALLIIGDNPNADGSISSKAYNGNLDQLRIYNRALSGGDIQNLYQAENPSNGLMFNWKFDEGTGKKSLDSVKNVIANFLISPRWVSGRSGKALSFDGRTSQVVTEPITYGNVNTFTFSSWINPHALGGLDGISNERIITKSSAAGQTSRRSGFHVTSDGALGFTAAYTGAQGSWKTPPGIITLSRWSHVAVSYSFDTPNIAPIFYLNGKVVPNITQTLTPLGVPIKDGDTFIIGDNPNQGGGASPRIWNGELDELRVYNRKVNATEIEALYNQDNQPNIIVIMTDDQDDTGSMEVMTKVKRLLKDEGVSFSNSFVSFPLCCASRASFLTAQYPHNNKIIGNQPSEDGGHLKFATASSTELSSRNSLPVWMQQAGYETTFMGKYLNGYGKYLSDAPEDAPTYIPPGWDLWMGMPDSLVRGSTTYSTYNYYNFAINNNGNLEYYPKYRSDGVSIATENYQTDVLTKKAVDFITARENSSKPFFMWVTPMAPHFGGSGDDATVGPFPAERHKGMFANLALPTPPNFNEADMSDKPAFMQRLPIMQSSAIQSLTQAFRNRRETIVGVDDMVESIVSALQRTNKLDNTIIVFTSDNGFSQGEHRRLNGKRVVYEESIRIPLVMRGPGIPKGETRTQMVNNLDVVATILDVAHANPGRTIDGRTLTSVFKNNSAPWRTAISVEGTDTYEGGTLNAGRFVAVRTDKFILVQHATTSSSILENEFYDLSKDPYQLVNRKDDSTYGAIISNLSSTLSGLRNCTGNSCFVTTIQPVQTLGVGSILFANFRTYVVEPYLNIFSGVKSDFGFMAGIMGVSSVQAQNKEKQGWLYSK